ncbi:ferrous iron transport protein A [Thiorhodococcus mannitoliphagus]|uniref:Ferrous iron transport protein A n=1 Tax=Thiorhodococcus mannitoliphagus TaxID=329406 RepID=A0A6P1DPV5_9GAMM|nr:FeoA family protein [Thiorhodococcus mannitoliphagus]NEX19183.1 ferrous iron transport protein A [Thiorhodococcus mannitoliphagus]
MSQQPQTIQLSDLPHRTPARLTEIRGGRHLTRRLLALGLRQGSSLCVVQRRGQGLVLASGDARIAVGSGIAEKLWVTPEAPHSGCVTCAQDDVEQVPDSEHLGLTS